MARRCASASWPASPRLNSARSSSNRGMRRCFIPLKKALQKANLGMNPAIHGKSVRLYFPELSQERRVEFVKIAKKMAEDGRVAIRHVRRDAMDQIKKHAHDSGVTEDDQKKAEKELQKLTDAHIAKIDTHLANKEKEIMTV